MSKHVQKSKTYILILKDGAVNFMRLNEQRRIVSEPDDNGKPHDVLEYCFSTVKEELAKWPAAERAKVASFREFDEKLIPKDRTFRNAWRDGGSKKVKVHMPHARDIWRNRMRKARAPKLAQLDIDYMKATQASPVTTAEHIIERKETLRNITKHPDIEAAKTPEALKQVWPEILN